ncbi:hypothetical protein KIPB_004087 [Kipferlia bialata]|uniref:Uncharacterized protein n=1 Tax=Kipferlia bialata TaxID=797122 RepID=A0A9K3CV46_9EUKA|nr:hypothetical protein KIPB_004087 [Kipferlia bialata]|eukprot:g4087.t1
MLALLTVQLTMNAADTHRTNIRDKRNITAGLMAGLAASEMCTHLNMPRIGLSILASLQTRYPLARFDRLGSIPPPYPDIRAATMGVCSRHTITERQDIDDILMVARLPSLSHYTDMAADSAARTNEGIHDIKDSDAVQSKCLELLLGNLPDRAASLVDLHCTAIFNGMGGLDTFVKEKQGSYDSLCHGMVRVCNTLKGARVPFKDVTRLESVSNVAGGMAAYRDGHYSSAATLLSRALKMSKGRSITCPIDERHLVVRLLTARLAAGHNVEHALQELRSDRELAPYIDKILISRPPSPGSSLVSGQGEWLVSLYTPFRMKRSTRSLSAPLGTTKTILFPTLEIPV